MSRPAARGLGRGLASLIPDGSLDRGSEAADGAFRHIPIDEIQPNPQQPRTVFDPDALSDLATSIKAHGVLSPLVVRRHEGRYVLVAGERRLRAAALAGLTEVPALVRDADGDATQLELALVENLQRADLDPVEAARGFHRLLEVYGYTQEEVAKAVGKNRATVANAVRLLKLPDFVLDALRAGHLSPGHARALLPLEQEAELRRAVAVIVAQQLSVRATERMVARLTRVRTVQSGADPGAQQRAFAYATKLLEGVLHTRVAIQPGKRGGGRIVIDYADAEDLERLIGHLRGGR